MAAMEMLFVESDEQPTVKLEPPFNDFTGEDTDREKIGDIYRIAMDHLAFVCAHCAAEFPLFAQFSMHIQQHLIDIKSNAFMAPAKLETSDGSVDIDIKPSVIGYEAAPAGAQLPADRQRSRKKYARRTAFVQSGPELPRVAPTSGRARKRATKKVPSDNARREAANTDHADDGSSDSSAWSGHWSDDSRTKITHTPMDDVELPAREQKCYKCKFSTSSERSLRLHEKQHRKADTHSHSYECYICHSSFQKYARCHQHIREHNSSTFRYKCDQCNTRFLREKHAQLHAVKCVPLNPIKCDLCPLTFRNPSLKHAHIHSFGGAKVPAGTQLAVCSACGAAYRNKADLVRHMQIHAKVLMKCEFNCDYDTYIASNYVHHVQDCPRKIETCPVCKKVFRMRNKFQTHMMRHQNIRNRQCAECGKRFTTGSGLTKHMYVHVGENHYKCDQCPRTYRRLDALTAHKRSHTGEHLKVCKFCPRTFVDKRSLVRHSLKVHGQPFDAET